MHSMFSKIFLNILCEIYSNKIEQQYKLEHIKFKLIFMNGMY